jgi:hypothetical protein
MKELPIIITIPVLSILFIVMIAGVFKFKKNKTTYTVAILFIMLALICVVSIIYKLLEFYFPNGGLYDVCGAVLISLVIIVLLYLIILTMYRYSKKQISPERVAFARIALCCAVFLILIAIFVAIMLRQ